jgi:hypothetical protein
MSVQLYSKPGFPSRMLKRVVYYGKRDIVWVAVREKWQIL